MKWARENEARFACCAEGLELVDAYNGGAAFMAFLAAEFGEAVHERLLRNEAGTFDDALASETRRSQSELLSRFRGWITQQGASRTPPRPRDQTVRRPRRISVMWFRNMPSHH